MEKPSRRFSVCRQTPPSELMELHENGDSERSASPTRNEQVGDLLTRRLIKAASRGSPFWVQYLKQNGADPRRQIDGITAIQAAIRGGNQTVMRRLSTNPDTLLLEVAKTSHVHMATLLLDQGADIHYADGMKQTALFFAAAEGNESMVRLLLRRGADRRHKDRQGRTPNMLARELRRCDIARLIENHRLIPSSSRILAGGQRSLRRMASCVDLELSQLI